ncbi:urease accessory protein UreE [Halobacterium hubeiense]|uniref:urease accessory protein UreE n=1 Tax=Halobacterium hubeiense TaxID=1407499 RepID=UPI003C71E451
MLVADQYLGHRDDPDIGTRLAAGNPYRVVLSDTDRRRSRVRTETADGSDLGIVVSRELGDGDVLETEDGRLVVVELAAIDALVVDFSDADVSATAALAFGHAAGNRHWNLAVRNGEALFPVPDTRERMLDALAGELPDGVTTHFERVPPTTFDDTGAPDHEHGHTHDDTGHTHSHSDGGHAHDQGVRTAEEAHDE